MVKQSVSKCPYKMVAIRETTPRDPQGFIDPNLWLGKLSLHYPPEKLKSFLRWLPLTTVQGLETANILLELHADLDTLLAALLIDHIDRLDHPPFHELPPPVLMLLQGNAALGKVEEAIFMQTNAIRVESIRQMLLAMIKDVRVVLLKLAEITRRGRVIKSLEAEKQIKLAREIMTLYAPLANRLGIGSLKWELEDRAFAILEPKKYREISQGLNMRRSERELFMKNFIHTLQSALCELQITAEVTGRVKHIYSIARKMEKKKLRLEDLFDVRAVRIRVQDIPSCYSVMAFLHAKWPPLVSEYIDYILQPKPNGYRSLHTVLLGEDALPIEVQIRTYEMHEQAESGIAAHWRYKEGKTSMANDERINWLRTLLDWQNEVSAQGNAPAPLEERVYVFTRDNEVFALKKGATPIDFAFLIHTQLGLRTRGAIVNGKMVALDSVLKMGDQVEILVHKTPNPGRDWLLPQAHYLNTTHARRKLRAYFREVDLASGSGNPLPSSPPVAMDPPKPKRRAIPRSGQQLGVSLSGLENLPFQLARCCNPEEGEPIIASITRARGLVIHRQSCRNIAYFQAKRPERLCEATWQGLIE